MPVNGKPTIATNRFTEFPWLAATFVSTILLFNACSSGEDVMDEKNLRELASRYTAAWNSHDAAKVASFYAEDGTLTMNDGEPSVGRDGVTAAAQGFITAFPDIVVEMDDLTVEGNQVFYHWTFSGTNTGPGGTGNAVRISGYEQWTIGAEGLITRSLGNYDDAEYRRQIERGVGDSDP